VIGRAFGVLKKKWRILKHLPSYPMKKYAKIILACMTLHNFIRDSNENDDLFDMCDEDEDFVRRRNIFSFIIVWIRGE
jgi:hypothetical protein